ncbi:MAG TPA: hypothetical protein VJ837_05405, partial [Candidatus Paceibacterota bacterium]|nr:hypothetical protein [Candidatus Paceibacterota bacterium]
RDDVLRAAPWGSQDSCALAVLDGFSAMGDQETCRQFATDYCAVRRERYPAPPRLKRAVHLSSA